MNQQIEVPGFDKDEFKINCTHSQEIKFDIRKEIPQVITQILQLIFTKKLNEYEFYTFFKSAFIILILIRQS